MRTMALRGQAAAEPQLGGYTEDLGYLEAMFPEYELSGALEQSIHVVVGDVDPGDRARVLPCARSGIGLWFGTALVLHGDDAGRHACPAPWEDATALEACRGVGW